MGKNRHSKDKLYIVASEYASDWGGYKTQNNKLPFRCLPFDCCFLSLLPFKNPLGTVDGLVFDAEEITTYIKQYGHNPITGKPLTMKDLFVLRFHKNSEGKYFCPVTEKQFNNHSFIVANRKTGHVYSNEAIDILCRKTKHWFDLITNEPFTATDLVIIQNPNNYALREIENFYYRKEGIKLASHVMREKGTPSEMGAFDPKMKSSPMTFGVLQEVKANEDDLRLKHKNLNINKDNLQIGDPIESSSGVMGKNIKKKHGLFTTHRQAASFTSTVVNISNELEYRDLTSKESRQEMYKTIKKKGKKGYVRLETNVGPLNFELHCDKVPETCFNFLLHCQNNYYRGTKFHRSIKNFMIQGGDPLGDGTGGISAFGENEPEFDDEFHPHLVHKGPGILSMANKGKNTNRSQFFITYNSCEHLNNQHSVFGQLVGGFATLTKLQNIPTTKNDVPKEDIEILECIVYEDPFEDYFQEEQRQDEVNSNEKIPLDELLDPMKTHEKRYSSQVGKYADFKKIIQQQQVSQRKKMKN